METLSQSYANAVTRTVSLAPSQYFGSTIAGKRDEMWGFTFELGSAITMGERNPNTADRGTLRGARPPPHHAPPPWKIMDADHVRTRGSI